MTSTSTTSTPIPTPTTSPALPGCQATEITLSQLVGQVYETAPPAERSRLLEQLVRPLGVLALLAVANGVFARIRLRSGWPDMHVPLEDVDRVQPGDVSALVDRVQLAGTDALDGLAGIVSASPVLAGSAAAALLLALLVQHTRSRRARDERLDADLDPLPPG